jgi:hypothetical protein
VSRQEKKDIKTRKEEPPREKKKKHQDKNRSGLPSPSSK